jgi:hypothetical protein
MATSYSSLLRLELPGNGDQSGVWGATTNNNLGTLLDQAIAGTASITMLDADYTLSAYNGVTDESRQMILNIGGTLTANRNIICPSTSKLYVIKNNTTGGFSVTLKTASGTGVTVTNGNTTIAYCDNTNVVDSVTALPANTTVGGVAIVTTTGTQTLTNKTLTAPKFADGGFVADANGNELIIMDTVTSAVNEVTVANAATSSGPSISSTGSDTNIDLLLVAKGTGVVKAGGVEVVTLTGTQALTNKTLTSPVLTTPRFADLGFIADANGNELIVMDTVASAVNEIRIANAATGGTPAIAAQGGDTNVGINLVTKGTGTVQVNGGEIGAITTENAQTGTTYTLVLSDGGKLVSMSNASANTLTVPPNSSVAFPIGTQISLLQYGAGQTTIAAGSGVTIRSFNSQLKLYGQYAAAAVWKRGTDEWVLVGNTTT